MMIRMLLAMVLAVLLGPGCATVVPKAVLEKVNRDITFEALKENPGAFEGQWVLLAGVIVKTTNTPDGVTLEIYQTEMDWEDRPINTDISGGRFLVQYGAFLDPEIYGKGRQLTIAGKVLGVKVVKLGEMDYPYPLILAEAIHLWRKITPPAYDPYPWYPMGVPWGYWGPWGPWYGPYW